jgi:hypothetical protein
LRFSAGRPKIQAFWVVSGHRLSVVPPMLSLISGFSRWILSAGQNRRG